MKAVQKSHSEINDRIGTLALRANYPSFWKWSFLSLQYFHAPHVTIPGSQQKQCPDTLEAPLATFGCEYLNEMECKKKKVNLFCFISLYITSLLCFKYDRLSVSTL